MIMFNVKKQLTNLRKLIFYDMFVFINILYSLAVYIIIISYNIDIYFKCFIEK